ncbi:cobyric acid synthase [Paenibacillus sp. N1-5-1-14]|uniref:cobyric acid synthase n=1 Tax=Paenibacillus radicibacter TaxID=2972488 RepID=UPI0021595C77|nr:cobyric acid synthase [Paenibacillus radicibacter]MCR8644891.1 cobyric acid synthase [Paenibacillus radicibacter]
MSHDFPSQKKGFAATSDSDGKSVHDVGRTLMVLGTASDVGKSIITAALCRIFTQDGWRTAPFKSQNMSNNSYVTPDGKEIGRAQGVQADACRVPATTDMNPILLKPKGDMTSQVVVHGVPYADLEARAYRESYLPIAEKIVKDALNRLRIDYEVVVMEGAGSPAEINLKSRDIVNMNAAKWGDAPVVLVADIDRGGVFASIVGTMEILEPEERARVGGFIINKFRGDVSLLQPGLDWLEEKTGKPVLGVIPYLPLLGIEDEDSASLDSKRQLVRKELASNANDENSSNLIDIAIIRFPRISNFTDMDPLFEEKDLHVRYISHVNEWGNPDAVILPGSKNTSEDLLFLQETDLAERMKQFAEEQSGYVVGICGGYQMLGKLLLDPNQVESQHTELDGLGLLPAITIFAAEKRTVRVIGETSLFVQHPTTTPITGYEIHMGRTEFEEPVDRPFVIRTDVQSESEPISVAATFLDGASVQDGRIFGTYIHGILHNDDFRRNWINTIRMRKGLEPLQAELRYQEKREAAFDRLADHVRKHLDLTRIYEMMRLNQSCETEEI